jgi:hypothetical protein
VEVGSQELEVAIALGNALKIALIGVAVFVAANGRSSLTGVEFGVSCANPY